MKKTNISIHDIQVAAFKVQRSLYTVTAIVKKTKSGHYFFNIYIDGIKQLNSYSRKSGRMIANYLGVTTNQLNNKLFDSTFSVWCKKHARAA